MCQSCMGREDIVLQSCKRGGGVGGAGAHAINRTGAQAKRRPK
jgi:hypothetical protein